MRRALNITWAVARCFAVVVAAGGFVPSMSPRTSHELFSSYGAPGGLGLAHAHHQHHHTQRGSAGTAPAPPAPAAPGAPLQ